MAKILKTPSGKIVLNSAGKVAVKADEPTGYTGLCFTAEQANSTVELYIKDKYESGAYSK